jgi:hypothetical protein
MYDVEDEWDYGEKRARASAKLEELVLDALIAALTKINKRNEWMNQVIEKPRDDMKF